MDVEILEDWNAVSALEAEWNGLLEASRANSIFLTWEWISSWMKVGGRQRAPFIICIRNAKQELVGIAPFYFSTLRLGRTIPYRTLRILADTATGAEYADWIVRPDVE